MKAFQRWSRPRAVVHCTSSTLIIPQGWCIGSLTSHENSLDTEVVIHMILQAPKLWPAERKLTGKSKGWSAWELLICTQYQRIKMKLGYETPTKQTIVVPHMWELKHKATSWLQDKLKCWPRITPRPIPLGWMRSFFLSHKQKISGCHQWSNYITCIINIAQNLLGA